MAKQKKKVRIIIIISLAILVLAGAVIGVYFWQKNKTAPYDSYAVRYTGALNSNAATEYLPYTDGYVKVNRDGAEATNSQGSVVWNVSYNMNQPTASVCGDYVAVGDCGNRTVYIMDGTGAVYTKNVPYPVSEVEVAKAGVAAVRMNDGMNDYIQIIDRAGEVLVDIKTLQNKDGFPVDIALSEDGTKLVTSYLVMEDGEAGGWLTFYNFGDVGQNYANNLTGIFKFEDVVPQIVFPDNNTLCAFQKDGITLYSIPELPEFIGEVKMPDPILHASYSDKYIAIMTDNTKAGTVSRTRIYDKSCKLVFDRNCTEDFQAITISGKDIVFYNPSSCLILRFDGTVKINTAFSDMSVNEIFPVNGNDKFMLFEDQQVSTIQLIHTKEGTIQ